MTEFIASPRPKRLKIPVMTVRQLIDALVQYLPTVVPLVYTFQTIECEREDKCTGIVFFGESMPGTNLPRKASVFIWEKATTSLDAKLWSDPFEIMIVFPYEQIRFMVTVTPREDRSIAFNRVV